MVTATEDVAARCFWGPEYEQSESLAFDSKAMAVQSHSFCLHRVLYPQISVSTGSSIPKHISPLLLYLSPVVWVRKKGGNIFEKSTNWIRRGLTHSEAGGLVTGWGAKHRERDQLSWAGESSHTRETHCHGVCEAPLRSSEFNRVVQEV